jgi:hypothetical protein
MIIGICGLIGSGKDTIADYLQNIHQFKRESFAHTLKDAVAAVFNWDRELLEGRTKHSREWRETVDPWWSQRLNMPHLTPRWVLQYWGTEVFRKGFADDLWIAALENKLRNSSDDIVITDCRFPNEIRAIRAAGGVVVRVQRGPDPKWFAHAIRVNAGPNDPEHSEGDGWEFAKHALAEYGVHASETAWAGTVFDYEINNDADGLDPLFAQINSLVLDFRAAMANHS